MEKYREDGQDLTFVESAEDGTPVPQSQQPKSGKICRQYLLFSKYKKFYNVILGGSLFFINYSFYFITWPLVALIGYRRNTIEEYINCNMIVICYVLDVTILPVMVGMNFQEVEYWDLLRNSFQGKFTDFEAGWYKTIGTQITVTMSIFCFQPIIDYIREFMMLIAYRWYAKNYIYKNRVSKDDDYLTWLDKHGGPEYYFYWRVAITQVTILISLLFGYCIPVLYLIAFGSLLL